MKMDILKITIVVAAILITGCSKTPSTPLIEVNFDEEMEQYFPLVEQSLTQRAQSRVFFESLENELEVNGYLTSESIHDLRYETKVQQLLREKLLSRAVKYEAWLDDESIEKELRLKGIMFSLSSAIVLYDNYLINLSMFQQQRHLRKIINAKDSEYSLESKALLHASTEYASIGNYLRMKKAIKFYQKEIAKDHEFDIEMVYLQTLIENSPSYRALMDKNFFQIVAQKLNFYNRNSTDSLEVLSNNSINLFSEFFGNSVGLVASRKGLMYNDTEVYNNIYTQLKAGDILLEKTPFRLTDSFIPGYWGHAAIWVGSQQELEALGIWNHPLVVPHHASINANEKIVEALRKGVVLNSLEHFLNIDDMAVLRENGISQDEKRAVLLHTFAQIGKDYDFNFDVETSDKIVCSELVYTAYTHIKWPTSKTLGRYTISPDNIANKTLNERLKLVLLYHEGKAIALPNKMWFAMLADEAL